MVRSSHNLILTCKVKVICFKILSGYLIIQSDSPSFHSGDILTPRIGPLDEDIYMTVDRKDKLAGALVSLPTFTDDRHNLLLDQQRKHIRWLMDNGIDGAAGIYLMMNCSLL